MCGECHTFIFRSGAPQARERRGDPLPAEGQRPQQGKQDEKVKLVHVARKRKGEVGTITLNVLLLHKKISFNTGHPA